MSSFSPLFVVYVGFIFGRDITCLFEKSSTQHDNMEVEKLLSELDWQLFQLLIHRFTEEVTYNFTSYCTIIEIVKI